MHRGATKSETARSLPISTCNKQYFALRGRECNKTSLLSNWRLQSVVTSCDLHNIAPGLGCVSTSRICVNILEI